MTCAALCVALCQVLPLLTGQIPQVGKSLLPMHIPAFLAGYLCGPWWALAVGLVSPLLRHILFGMPQVPSCYAMAAELATYGFVCGFCYQRSAKKTKHIYASLLLAMVLGRITGGLAMKLLMVAKDSPYTWAQFFAAYGVNGLPGAVLHILLVPVLVRALQRQRTF